MEQEFFDDEEDVGRCLVEFSGIPIGYVQFYIVREEEERQAYGYGDSVRRPSTGWISS